MRSLTWIGVILIILGVLFVLIPFVEPYVSLEDIPPWLIYVYRRGNFYFATSPILILISVLVVLLRFLSW